MRAIVYQEIKNFDSLELKEVDYPKPASGEAVVRVKAAALNRRDVWITQDRYPEIKVPVILGSDGAGMVSQVGSDIDERWLNKPVIINPSLNWGPNPRAQQQGYRILGMPDDGTQAEYVRVPVANLVEKPEYLSFEQAAAIPLAGLTGYRALFTQGNLRAGETVLLTGIGGGVATLMMQMALAAGTRVLVTSGADAKLKMAVEAGAAGGANYKNKSWSGDLKNLATPHGIDLIVDSAAGDGFNELISLVSPGGRIVFFGVTTGNSPQIDMFKTFWKQITLQGTTMGTPMDFAQMVRLFDTHRITPMVDGPYPLNEFRKAYLRMKESEQFGKIVLSLD